MGIFTCKPDCAERKPGCHDHCEKYQAEKAEHTRCKANAERWKEAQDYTYSLRAKRANRKAKKRLRYKF